MKAFQDLHLRDELLKAIVEEGYEAPTPIQKKTIPIMLKGIDVIGAAKSGTGKTAAFVLPTLQLLSKDLKTDTRVLRCLILVPTRELAMQVSRAISFYGRHLDLVHAEIYGGVSNKLQQKKLAKGVDIVVATSGRLKDHITNNGLDLSSVNRLILDEADTMLDMGFLGDIEELFSLCSPTRQISMFSATISQNVRKLAKEFLKSPVTIELTDRRQTVDLIDHEAYKVDVLLKKEMLSYLIGSKNFSQILIFVNTKMMANTLVEHFNLDGIPCEAVHGDIKQPARARALRKFKKGELRALIATDIAARGIDIEQLPLVVNYSLPETTDDFTHRVGRTGRAGIKGNVITLLTVKDYRKFEEIEKDLILSVPRLECEGFELTDREPRRAPKRNISLSEKKGQYKTPTKKPKSSAKTSKKTTKRDEGRSFRKK